MDLILWRHAEAEDDSEGGNDLARALTPRGHKQAVRMASWLERNLPEGTRILCSPARRCEQTVLALGRRFSSVPEIAPNNSAAAILQAANWPHARLPVLMVGHQPAIGQAIAQLLEVSHGDCAVRKGSVWWLRSRERHGHAQTVLLAVQAPELL